MPYLSHITGRRFAVLLVTLCATSLSAREDVSIADFESGSYAGWKVEGSAFEAAPVTNAATGQKSVRFYGGKYFVNSYGKGDIDTGRLLSPEFTVERNYIRFLIGGGEFSNKVCINLLVDGETARTATGLKSKIGRNEALRFEEWHVAELAGKAARIEIVDGATNSAAHILVDEIVQTDEALKYPSLDLAIRKNYLLLPVKNRARMVPLALFLDGKMVREFDIELAMGEKPDWWAFYDMRPFKGKTLQIISSDKLPVKAVETVPGLLQQSNKPIADKDVYEEAFRPQFHFTVKRGFNNDPNGLVYFNGYYHMFYQNNPFGIEWGNMHWGHAVSKDLLHWQELLPAIYPLGLGGAAFSGGASVDYGNKTGWGKGKEDVMIVSYTGIGRGECIAYGTGRALELHDIPENPVFKHRGWDPNIMRFPQWDKWIIAVYERDDVSYGYAFYDSTNLISWRRLSFVPGFQDCPDLFELPVEGESSRKWVLYGSKKEPNQRYASRSSYMIGSFDGEMFTPETEIIEGHVGPHYYAAQTIKENPDDRKIMISWLSGAKYPGMPFSQGMTFPAELKLRRTAEGVRMCFAPVREIEKLYRRKTTRTNLDIAEANELLADTTTELLDISVDASVGKEKFKFKIRGSDITYDPATQEITCRDAKSRLVLKDGRLRLRVLVDRGVLEMFADDGLVAMAFGGRLYSKDAPLKLEAGGGARVNSLTIAQLKSIWK